VLTIRSWCLVLSLHYCICNNISGAQRMFLYVQLWIMNCKLGDFRLLLQCKWDLSSLKKGPIGCPTTSIPNYQSKLHNILEEWRPWIVNSRLLKFLEFISCPVFKKEHSIPGTGSLHILRWKNGKTSAEVGVTDRCSQSLNPLEVSCILSVGCSS
jgi:hypothetical protein